MSADDAELMIAALSTSTLLMARNDLRDDVQHLQTYCPELQEVIARKNHLLDVIAGELEQRLSDRATQNPGGIAGLRQEHFSGVTGEPI